MAEPVRRLLGIDPGLTGGLVALDVDAHGHAVVVAAHATPTLPAMRKGALGIDYDVAAMQRLLAALVAGAPGGVCAAMLERASTRPGQAAGAVLRTGEGYGLWRGLLAGAALRVVCVTAVAWKRHANLLRADKRASVVRAKERFPELAALRASQHGIAEAALIAAMGVTA